MSGFSFPHILQDSRGWLAWAPDLVLGVDIREAGSPDFPQIVKSRYRCMVRRHHPDKNGGRNVELCK